MRFGRIAIATALAIGAIALGSTGTHGSEAPATVAGVDSTAPKGDVWQGEQTQPTDAVSAELVDGGRRRADQSEPDL